MDGLILQAFQCPLTHKDIKIQVQRGATPNESFVLWNDIKSAFPGAKSIRIEDFAVPFMKDTDYNLIKPWRIAYYPGVTLEVVIWSDTQPASTCEVAETTGVKTGSTGHDDKDNDLYSESCTEIYIDTSSMVYKTTSLTIAEADASCQTLVKYSKRLPDRPRSPPTSNQLHNTYLQSIKSEQQIHTADIRQSLDRRFDQLLQHQQQSHDVLLEELQEVKQSLAQERQLTLDLRQEIRRLHQLQQNAEDQLVKRQNKILDLQQSSKKELLKKQEEMLDLQKQTLNRLAVILSHVRALLTQTYELHEYPTPRLFIVLPKSTGFHDNLTNPFSEQFRLYFLCECGTHTMSGSSRSPPEVHLAKHDGYELEKPKEFFEKYGSYITAMMCMIKYGIIAGSVVVPPLANLKILDGLEAPEKHMEYLRKNITPLVNDTLSFLQNFYSSRENGGEISLHHAGFNKLEALEGADLRQLESYLNVKDKGRVLGNLYRIVTSEGHVKWVCLDHFRASYRESAIEELQRTVQYLQGTFIEDTGTIGIGIATSLHARHFYEAMVKARGTHELEIKLNWDATMDDLRELCDAVSKANVIRLTVDGSFFKGPTVDFVNRGRRFDPIWKLASNARIQSLRLVGFDDFFSRVTKYTSPAPKLRQFSMEWKAPLDGKALRILNGFLEHCSGLTALALTVYRGYRITKAFMDVLTKLHQLESLSVDYGLFSLTTGFLQGNIQDTNITFVSPELGGLAETLRQSDGLARLRIGGESPAAWVKLRDLMIPFVRIMSNNLKSLFIDYRRFTLTASFSEGSIQDMTMIFAQLKDLTPDDIQFIQLGPYNQMRIANTGKEDEDSLIDIFRQYSMLVYILVRRPGEHHHVIRTTTTSLQDLMTLATSETPSTIESFSVVCRGLSLNADFSEGGVQDMAMTIAQLDGLYPNDLRFMKEAHLTRLTVKRSSPVAEAGLAEILRQCRFLNHLQVGCASNRSIDIVKLVVSTREDIITQNGSFSLRTFKLMDENLTPFDVLASRDKVTYIQSHLSFQEDSKEFEMQTWIRLGIMCFQHCFYEHPVVTFIFEYLWSVVFLDAHCEDYGILGVLYKLLHFTKPQLESIMVCSNNPHYLDGVVQLLPNLKELGLYMYVGPYNIQEALSLLDQYGTILSRLQLSSTDNFSRVASSCPTRKNLPALKSFELNLGSDAIIPPNFTPWIVAMVSAPPERLASLPSSEQLLQDTVADEQSACGASESARTWTPLNKVMLHGVQLEPDEWRSVVETLDVSALEYLDLRTSNIAQEQFEILVGRIADNNVLKLPFRTLDIGGSSLVKETDSGTLGTIFTKLRKEVPSIKINFYLD
ncbi:hypothetical protein BGX34_005199 [Mortierella sp. NVP85]|nr:hypothetical protein BGX34_005199 [Mortierella sp. NVP85]